MVLIKWFNNKILPHLCLCSSSSSNEYEYEYYFPEEILIKILVKLPADSVWSYKKVCQRWKSIISSPYFRNLHAYYKKTIDQPLNYHNTNEISVIAFTKTFSGMQELGIYEGGLGFKGRKKVMFGLRTSYPTKNRTKPNGLLRYLTLIGSCDGLLVFDKFSSPPYTYGLVRCWIIVLNPFTRETRVIEYPRGPVGYVCGFFFDKHQFRHNLLHVSPKHREYQVFSFPEGVWRRIETPSRANDSVPPCMHTSPPVLVDDALHWIVDRATQVLSKSVMAFKIETNEIYYFPHPILAVCPEPREIYYQSLDNGSCQVCASEFRESGEEKMQLIEKNGKLCFCHMINQYSMIDIWMLEEYGDWSSWVRRFKVVFRNITISDKCLSTREWGPTILSFPHEDVIAVKWNHKNIYLYHLIKHKSSSIDDEIMFPCNLKKTISYRFTAWNKTLLSPDIL